MSRLFVFGLGYSASAAAAELEARGFEVVGTVRTAGKAAATSGSSVTAIPFHDVPGVRRALGSATHILVSVPPAGGGDPALKAYEAAVREALGLRWLGYLSTIGVYGDHGGAWVNEDTPVSPISARAEARILAERAWSALASELRAPLDIFRLAGIYGPGRSALDRIREGGARRIAKPGHVSNRIHVEDIGQVVAAAAVQPGQGSSVRIFNVADDEPAPPEDVVAYAAELLGLPLPPVVRFEEAQMSAMARSFYEGNKRVCNDKMKRELGVRLRYPTYQEGLQALMNAAPISAPPAAV